jgi:hypothetical protein
VEGPGGLAPVVRLSDENRAPIGPSTGTTSASGPVVAGKSYFVSVRAASDKSSNPRDPYSVTLTLE